MYSMPAISIPDGNLQEKGEEMIFKELVVEKFPQIRNIS